MKPSKCFYILNLTSFATSAIVYITDLPNFSPLAPCARNAMAYAIATLTYQECPGGQTQLQSCVCTKNNNVNAVSKTITGSILLQCSSTATEDVTSALAVYSDYCNQGPPRTTTAPVTSTKAGAGRIGGTPSAAGSPESNASVSEPETKTNTPKETGNSSSASKSTPTSTPNSITTATNGVPMAPVIGGAVAFIVLMVSGLIAFFCYRRNNKQKMKRMQEIQQTTIVGPIMPLKHDTHHTHNQITHNHSFTNNIHNTTTNNTPLMEHPPNVNMYPQPSNHSLPEPLNHQQQHPPPFSSSSTPTTPYRKGIGYTNQPNRLLESARNPGSHPSLQNQLPQYRPQEQTPQSHSPPMNRRPVARPSPKSRNDYEVEEM